MGIFYDKRIDKRYISLCLSMRTKYSVTLRKLASSRNEEIAYGRFLKNPRVEMNQLLNTACFKTAHLNTARDVLLIEDTSTIGLGVNSRGKGFAAIGDGKSNGFYLHPVISVDAANGHVLGLASAQVYERQTEALKVDENARERMLRLKRERCRQLFEKKESYRWYSEIEKSLSYGRTAQSYTVVADREADIYPLMDKLQDQNLGFVIRSSSNRIVNKDKGQTIKELLDQCSIKGSYELNLPSTDKRSAHKAKLSVKWTKADIIRPRSGTGLKELSKKIAVNIIEIKEDCSTVVGKEKPIHWRLLTSHSIESLSDALRVIQYYVYRWIIEQVFRTIKKKGLDVKGVQVKHPESIKKLSAIALITGIEVMQLVQARNLKQGLNIDAVFDNQEQQLIAQLSSKLEGKTDKLKNPNEKDCLAYASWVMARLGGWSGYTSQRPPGPITMLNGLKRFKDLIELTNLINPGLYNDP